jgi:integrase
MSALTGKLSKSKIKTLGPGRHGDGDGLYLIVDPPPSKKKRWIVRVTVKGQKNRKGAPLRTDFGLGGADVVSLDDARERALEYRRLAKQGLNPRFHGKQDIPNFEEMAQQVHIARLPTWKNPKHAQQWINTLRDYAFPFIGRMPVNAIDQPEVLMCLSPIWTEKNETARRLAQRIKIVLDVAKSKGFRDGGNPVVSIRDGNVLPKVKVKPKHHAALAWQDTPAFYQRLSERSAMAAIALKFTILTASRTNEVLGMEWNEVDWEKQIWTCPEVRMKTGEEHRVPLTDEMIVILKSLRPLESKLVFEGQKRHRPLSNMSMLMLLRRMAVEDVTVHGFRSTFRVWAAEVAKAPREVAEMCLSHSIGSEVERSYARSDLLEQRRKLMDHWSSFMIESSGVVVRAFR